VSHVVLVILGQRWREREGQGCSIVHQCLHFLVPTLHTEMFPRAPYTEAFSEFRVYFPPEYSLWQGCTFESPVYGSRDLQIVHNM
jgi:hypothetical protein